MCECVCQCVVLVGSTKSGLARHFLGADSANTGNTMSVDVVHARNRLAGDGQSSHSVGPDGRGRGASRVDGETDLEIS